jgi:hypothetical protein
VLPLSIEFPVDYGRDFGVERFFVLKTVFVETADGDSTFFVLL